MLTRRAFHYRKQAQKSDFFKQYGSLCAGPGCITRWYNKGRIPVRQSGSQIVYQYGVESYEERKRTPLNTIGRLDWVLVRLPRTFVRGAYHQYIWAVRSAPSMGVAGVRNKGRISCRRYNHTKETRDAFSDIRPEVRDVKVPLTSKCEWDAYAGSDFIDVFCERCWKFESK